MKVYSAPLQGYTTAPWRHYHSAIYGAADGYFSPFVRVEHGMVRRHDLNDVSSELNSNHCLMPQIIFRNKNELELLTSTIVAQGYRTVDLNMGCPFPPQVKRGKGAAVVSNIELLHCVKAFVEEMDMLKFSVKMRLGVDDAEQWKGALDVLNDMPLTHITLHPRTAVQQYDGEPQMDQFGEFLARCAHPVIYNGDITSPEDINAVSERFPSIVGVMIGRGLLARPSLIAEWRSGEQWSSERQLTSILQLHDALYKHHAAIAQGDVQLLQRIKPFWDYLEPLIGHKTKKLISKATSVAKYGAAIAQLR